MFALFVIRVLRRAFRGTTFGAHLSGLLDKEFHPRVHHVYYGAAIVVYLAHITVSLHHGIEAESCVTAAAAFVELIAHLCE